MVSMPQSTGLTNLPRRDGLPGVRGRSSMQTRSCSSVRNPTANGSSAWIGSAVLNNRAQLLQATNRLTEAEPLMRRALVILLEFTLKIGHSHPHFAMVFSNYKMLLEQMSVPEDQITERFAEIGKEAGFDEEGFARVLELVSTEMP